MEAAALADPIAVPWGAVWGQEEAVAALREAAYDDGSQTSAWLTDLGAGPSPVRAIPIQDIAPGVIVEGPVPGLDDEVRELHRRYRSRRT